MHTTIHPATALVALVLASLACSIFVGGPDLPTPSGVEASESLDSLDTELERAATESLTTGTLEVQFTQEQLTAYVANLLANQSPPLLSDPQVVLGDQELTIYGHAKSGILEANASITTAFSVDEAGKPIVRISHAELGPIPMPDALKDGIAAAIDEALTGAIGPAAIGFRLESIDISGGIMKITGRVR